MKNMTLSISTIWEYNYCFRSVIKLYLQDYIPLISLPGPIEIDEAQLGTRRRGSHGRLPGQPQLVFGKIFLIIFVNFKDCIAERQK